MLRRRLERVAVVVVGLLRNRVGVRALRLAGFRSVFLLYFSSFLLVELDFSSFSRQFRDQFFFRLWLVALTRQQLVDGELVPADVRPNSCLLTLLAQLQRSSLLATLPLLHCRSTPHCPLHRHE